MKNLLIILTALFVTACGKTQLDLQTASTQSQANNGVLIIFYDKTETSVEQLIKQGEKWHIELVYDYQNLNGLAIRVPNKNDIESVKNTYRQTKGVLSVKNDQINQLH